MLNWENYIISEKIVDAEFCKRPFTPLSLIRGRISMKSYCCPGKEFSPRSHSAGINGKSVKCDTISGSSESSDSLVYSREVTLNKFNSRLTSLSSISQKVTEKSGDHFLPMSQQEMKDLGWKECDIVLVTGDAYIDHPSFAMAILGRTLEHFGFRVGIISQPDWHSCRDFMKLGRPRLFFGVSAGNMDSMVNHYTADRKLRHDDAYTEGNESGHRPDHAAVVYCQRCREAYRDVPVVVGGIEASLRRIAHFDYWSETVKRPLIFDARADLLLYGSGEHSLTELALRLNNGENIRSITDIRGSAVIVNKPLPGWEGLDCRSYRQSEIKINPSEEAPENDDLREKGDLDEEAVNYPNARRQYLLLPDYDSVKNNPRLYAHSMYLLHNETNPYCARALLQYCTDRGVWINPPPVPLTTPEMDLIYDLPYLRRPHPVYKKTIPAYEMIKNSITALRGCFGGCAFCTIAAHEGKFIQSRSPESIIREAQLLKSKVPGFAGVISDIGGPSANMYRLGCKNKKARSLCRRESCLFPHVCQFLETSQKETVDLYRKVRNLPEIKHVFIGSGIRLDLAILDPDYVREITQYHVSGHLKVAPEHTEKITLNCMRKPDISTYDDFERLFVKFSQECGRKQQIIPYFIAAHPGSDLGDMINLALWLKRHRLKVDQVQSFYPTPLSNSTTMYYSGFDPGSRISDSSPEVFCIHGEKSRRIQKAILRYHDPANWDIIRSVLKDLHMEKYIGNAPDCLVGYPDKKPRNTYRQDLARGRFSSRNASKSGTFAKKSGQKNK